MPITTGKRIRIGFIGVGNMGQAQPGRVTIFKDPGQGATPVTLVPDLPPVHAMRNQALNFIRAVRGEAPAPCLAPEAVQDLRIARDYLLAQSDLKERA